LATCAMRSAVSASVPHWSIEFPSSIYPYFVPGWTLNYEMFFYGIFALAIAFGRPLLVTSAVIGALVAAGVAAGPTSAVGITYTSPQLLQFLAGVWIGYLHSRAPVRRFGVLLPIGAVVIFLVGDNVLLRGLCAAAILLGALSLEPSMPRIALLKRLGDASYAVYLFHVPALIFMSGVVKRMPVPPGALQFALMIVGGLAAAAALGLLLHRYLEKPLLRALRNPPGPWGIGAACCLAAAAVVALD
jgi:exopolysaccharide production protein ExoZ